LDLCRIGFCITDNTVQDLKRIRRETARACRERLAGFLNACPDDAKTKSRKIARQLVAKCGRRAVMMKN
jgi:hypothetical protein